MKRAYFIYSNDRVRDREIVKDLHNWLPTDIDIVEGKIKDGKIINLAENERKEMPACLINLKRPIYLAEDALEELTRAENYSVYIGFSSNIWALEFLKSKEKDVTKLVDRLASEEKIISGEEEIRNYIEELKMGKRFIF